MKGRGLGAEGTIWLYAPRVVVPCAPTVPGSTATTMLVHRAIPAAERVLPVR